MQNIAFYGLGTMGTGMVGRLLGAGYPVTIYNRTAERAAPLVALGAKLAASPREAAGSAHVHIAMLADDPASRAVWLGEGGALAAAHAGDVLVDCSTLTVPWVHELAAAAGARGMKFLDAPVTGTKPHAANGELVFIVGGDAATLDLVRPVLAPMSKQVIHVGPTGSGAALKLINNYLCGVQAAAFAEALAMIKHAGLDSEKALPFLLGGAPGSPLINTLAKRHGAKDYTPNFQLRLMAKDIAYAIAFAQSKNLDLTTAKAALGRFTQAADAGLGNEDMSAVLKFMENF